MREGAKLAWAWELYAQRADLELEERRQVTEIIQRHSERGEDGFERLSPYSTVLLLKAWDIEDVRSDFGIFEHKGLIP